jgi:hypothetical protein
MLVLLVSILRNYTYDRKRVVSEPITRSTFMNNRFDNCLKFVNSFFCLL